MRSATVILFLTCILCCQFVISQAVSPPPQPEKGPGGKEYKHASVTKNRFGNGENEYWIYEPERPTPSSAPVIVFLHGWGATNPAIYGAWIDHLVRRGNILVYPRYQENLRTPLKNVTLNAMNAIRDAIGVLQTDSGHVRPEIERVAVVGHSLGGLITANITALAREEGVPQPVAMMSVQPGRTWNRSERLNLPLADLEKIPEKTLLLAIIGDRDTITRDIDAKRIYYESEKVTAENKDFVTLVSDSHGKPALIAHHSAPAAFDAAYNNGDATGLLRPTTPDFLQMKMSERNVNALDFYGTWKLFDGLYETAFYGKNREYALGNTPEQRNMSVWSDGIPVNKLVVTDRP